MVDFEKSYEEFLERRELDQATDALFSIVRIAFKAGWLAANGTPPEEQNVVELIQPEWKIPPENHPGGIKTDIL